MAADALLILALVGAFAGLVQSTAGFGFGIVFLAAAGFWLDPKQVSLVSAFVSVLLNARLLWALWRDLQWRPLWPVALSLALCVPLGVWLLQGLNSAWFNLLLGLLILWALGQQLLPRRQPGPGGGWLAWPMGALSGLFTGAYNTGGPPLVVYVQAQGFGRLQQVASLQLLLLLGSLVRVEELWRQQLLSSDLLLPVAIAGAATLAGSVVGLRLLKHLSERLFKTLVAALLLLLALVYIGRWALAIF